MDGTVTIGTKIDTSGLEASLNKMETTLNKRMNGMTRTITNSFKSMKRFILGLGIAKLISSMFDMGDAIKRVDTINNYARVMGNLGISAEAANKSINILSEKLMGLPTALDDAALSVQRLTSANGSIEASTQMFLALNNAILAGGASMELQKSALEQITQAYSKNKPDMMEWRTMMMAMPAQLKQISEQMGYASSNALGEALRAGKVSMNDFMVAITQLNSTFEEQARNATGGIGTSLVNLKTAFTRALADIMNAIGQANIADFFNGIAKAISKVVPYIAGFAKAIMMVFGFGKSTTKNTDKASKSITNLGGAGTKGSKGLNKATGSAKKLNKELKKLASFDEMNILDKLDKAASGSGNDSVGGYNLSGIDTSAFDMASSNMDSLAQKTQEIANKILPFLKLIKDNWQAVVGAIAGVKIGLDLLHTSLKPLMALGIGVILGGIVETILAIITFIKDPTWSNFVKILGGLETILIGIGIVMLSINAASPVGWMMVAVGLVSKLIGGMEGLAIALGAAGAAMIVFNSASPIGWISAALGVISGLIALLFGEEDQASKTAKAEKSLAETREEARKAASDYISAVDNQRDALKHLEEMERKTGKSGFDLAQQVKNNEINVNDLKGKEWELYKAYVNLEDANSRLHKAMQEKVKIDKEETKGTIEQSKRNAERTKSYDSYRETVIRFYKEGKISAQEAMQYFQDAIGEMDQATAKTFTENIPDSMKKALGTEQYNASWKQFEKWWTSNIDQLNKKLTVNAKYTVTAGGYTPSGQVKRAKGGLFYPSKLPKLALGGVINRPGSGIPYHGATIAERGAEAVLPLTDSQQMMLLGEAIGKYITINANITNTMNGRVISRELQKINTDNDFAYNR